jgi:hypothetical protein
MISLSLRKKRSFKETGISPPSPESSRTVTARLPPYTRPLFRHESEELGRMVLDSDPESSSIQEQPIKKGGKIREQMKRPTRGKEKVTQPQKGKGKGKVLQSDYALRSRTGQDFEPVDEE